MFRASFPSSAVLCGPAVAAGAAALTIALAPAVAQAAPHPSDAAVGSLAPVAQARQGTAVTLPGPVRVTDPDGGVSQVVGPLPVTDTSYPFGAADHQLVPQDLADFGYVEEEYLVSGSANVYSWTGDGPATVRTPGAPYTTRVLVRRPVDVEAFSGTTVVEMLNPSNLFDLNIGWALTQAEIMDAGHVWVGITAKPIAVDALKTFDPARYGTLAWDNPLPLDDPANCATVAADSDRSTENGLVWDIYTQVGQWLRSDDGTNPLTYGGSTTRVENALSWGYSQTGGFLVNYINGVLPHVIEEEGASVYDGYTVAVGGGGFAGAYPMNQCEQTVPVGPARQLQDVGVPVMRIMSQSDYLLGIASRRPDSDEPRDRYRHYELAGAGHATPEELYFSAAPADIEKADRDVPPMNCDQGPRSRMPNQMFYDAALRNMEAWVRDDVAPPRVEPIEVVDGKPVLDEFGNVKGGWRSPYLEVPTSTWSGTATGASFCFIAGWEQPFGADRMLGLYPTRDAYAMQVRRSTDRLVRARLLTEQDAALVRADVPVNLTSPGASGQFLLTDDTTPVVAHAFDLVPAGTPDRDVFVGDWDGDGVDTVGYRTGNVLHLSAGSGGQAASRWIEFAYGWPGDEILVGDWDGDGTDSVGLRRANLLLLRDSQTGGRAEIEFGYGRATDVALAGDWNGDGRDTVAVRRDNLVMLRNSLSGGLAEREFGYGWATDAPLAGDWDGDGADSFGVRRGNTFHLREALSSGPADVVLPFGRADDGALVGDWDGDDLDTPGAYRRG